jgi:hypothetical protein
MTSFPTNDLRGVLEIAQRTHEYRALKRYYGARTAIKTNRIIRSES